jgi:hypothetical protein
MEQEMSDEEKDVGSDAFVRNLSNILIDAKAMLEEKAAEFGIELGGYDDEGANEKHAEHIASVRSNDMASLAEKYAFDLRPVLAERDEWLVGTAIDADLLEDVLAVLYWYQFFIAAKIERGLGGIIDEDGDEQLNDPQSDANGSIKVALIAIERSILAWTYLLDVNNAAVIRPFMEMLERLKQMAETQFPISRDFIRPGFDEIEIVM